MSEAAELDPVKAEKLRRRQEQLAKWKSKKTLTTDRPSAGKDAVTTSKATADDMKLERLKKLEEWKRKRQLQADLLGPGASPTVDSKNQRLEEWKKNRSEISGFHVPFLRNKISIPPKKPLLTGLGATSLFGDAEDEQEGLRKFKKPSLDKAANKNKNFSPKIETEDALDLFLETLESHKPEPGVSRSQPATDESESEALDNDEQQRFISAKMKNLQKEKALLSVDHSQIEYKPFRKRFYEEPDSIKEFTQEDFELLRLSMDGIKVTGTNAPAPIWEWDQLGLSSLTVSILKNELRFDSPTPIQSQGLPAIMSGRDFLGIAKTGSGKTLAFVLPLLRHVQDQPLLEKGDGPIGILLTPTRELAIQIHKVLLVFGKKMSISVACCYGGSSIEPQIAELKRGSQIVVATPGRMIDLLAANGGRICNLRRVTYVVLDEADRMFDCGFEPQVNKILSQVRPDRQSILFSATFARKMEALAKAVLNDPVQVVVGGINVVAPEIAQHVKFFELEGSETESEISAMKLSALLEILAKYTDVKKLVFVEKQESADNLLVQLLGEKYPCVAIHGGKEQIDRKYAIKEFSDKNSGVDIMLATSIAARGLDVKGLDLVINYDPANHIEDYVHRVGRTGRAGAKGDAYTFVTSDQERAVSDLVKAMRLSAVPDSHIDSRLSDIAEKFSTKVKEGKEKFRFGFGGKGLTKLDEVRKTNQVLDRRAYECKSGETIPTEGSEKAQSADREKNLDLPEFKIIEGKAAESTGPDKCKFHTRITINDLPQKARWAVVNADSLAQIIESTSTSITNKGQYYPPNTNVPKTIKQGNKEVPAPAKLYLLVEGLTEFSVKESNRMIRQKMIEGLEQAAADEPFATTGKYTV